MLTNWELQGKLFPMSKKQEDTLIKVWNRLEDMWCHHQDGSDFLPISKKYLGDPFSKEVLKERKERGNESILFDIIFNEINLISKQFCPIERYRCIMF